MRFTRMFGLAGLLVVSACSEGGSPVAPEFPSPSLAVAGGRDYPKPKLVLDNKNPTPYLDGLGNPYLRYELSVNNSSKYPDELFAPAPTLPPCGLNTNSSRTWVVIFEGDGTPIFGFCALQSASDLNDIWFSIPEGAIAPSKVYITLTDRQSGKIYTSNKIPLP